MVIVLPATAAAEAADAAAKKRAEKDLKRTLENIKNLMLGMVGVVAAICLIYVGFLYMKAGDTPEARLNAKRHLQSVLFGLLICLLASTIVSVVSGCVVGS
jgi:type IV secretory pathway VirB2 component (pilin)